MGLGARAHCVRYIIYDCVQVTLPGAIGALDHEATAANVAANAERLKACWLHVHEGLVRRAHRG